MPNFTKDAFAKTEARLKAMEDAKAKEIEYIPVDQAAGAPKLGHAQSYPGYPHRSGEATGAQAEIMLYGIRDSDVYSIKLTVNAASGLQAIDELMSAIREAKRVYALSPIQPANEVESTKRPTLPEPMKPAIF